MSTPTAKRRRLDAAQTLSKPFRSPFKTPFKSPLKAPQDGTAPTPNNSLLSFSAAPLADKTTNSLLSPHTSNTPKLRSAPPSLLSTPNRATTRGRKTFTSPLQTAVLNADPDVAPLLKTQRELERQLREVKEELEGAEQARKIERESGEGEIDGELVELIEKWRGASRLAAEELFGKVRDRVNRMGGPRAWKQMQKKQQEDRSTWDQEEPTNKNSDDEDEDEEGKGREKRDVYAEYGIDEETENEKSQRAKGAGDTGERPGEEDEFTMAMMLRTLNVDLDIIGWDKQMQRWDD